MSLGRRAFLLDSARVAVGTFALGAAGRAHAASTTTDTALWRERFSAISAQYFLTALRRHPVVSTYLGGSAISPALAESDGLLRDYRPEVLADELNEYRDLLGELAFIPAGALSAADDVDRAVMAAQVDYRLRTLGDDRQYERAVDTYVIEPFRGIDLQLRQLDSAGHGLERAWELISQRVEAIPAFVDVARSNLLHGRMHGNEPDRLLIQEEGIDGSQTVAAFYSTGLVAHARHSLSVVAGSGTLMRRLEVAAGRAGTAYQDFAHFLEEAFSGAHGRDRFAIGEDEYDWRLRHCLAVELTSGEVFERGEEKAALRRRELLDVAREIAVNRRLGLRFGTRDEQNASLHAVKRALEREAPRDDDQLLAWYRDSARRLEAYVRDSGWFEASSEDPLQIVPTPAALQGTSAAAYYPAPPLTRVGGVMFVTPVGNDPADLAQNNRFRIASTLAHEAYPGHHWHFTRMALHAGEIPHLRWLTPGAVENSLSMWEDSMATEGWATYAAALMGEARPGLPHGAYSAEEHFYQLKDDLLVAVGLHLDVGLHTGRLSRGTALQWLIEQVGFEGPVQAQASMAADDDTYRRCHPQIARYAKWPTQAVTYELGREAIEALRDRMHRQQGAAFELRRFHEGVMRMGTIPPGRYEQLLLAGESDAAAFSGGRHDTGSRAVSARTAISPAK